MAAAMQFLMPILCAVLPWLLVGCNPNAATPRAAEDNKPVVPTASEAPARDEGHAAGPLRVAVAANLKFAFDEIAKVFEEQHPDVSVEAVYGSSGNFFAQLTQGAPFDVFLSADTRYPDRLVQQLLVNEEDLFLYAHGRIVVWARIDSSLDVLGQGLQVLTDPQAQMIAIANPKLAPYGLAAQQALQHEGIFDQVSDRLVLGENIAQTAQFVDTGAADVGIIALSLALSERLKERGKYAVIPEEWHQPIQQAGVVLSDTKHPDEANKLKAFVLGPDGQEILTANGYSIPTAGSQVDLSPITGDAK